MKKIFFLSLGLALSLGTQAKDCHHMADTTTIVRRLATDEMLRPLKPSYMKGALVASPWTDNWFIQAAGGTTAFLGTPLGCNDLLPHETGIQRVTRQMVHTLCRGTS